MKALYLFSLFLLLAIVPEHSVAQAGPVKTPSVSQHQLQPVAERHGYSVFRGTLVDLPWPEVKKAADADTLVILPIGVIEEHGPHLSLGADTYLAHKASQLLTSKLAARQINSVVLPPMYWGIMQANETGAYPGSLTVRPETMKAVLRDIFTDLEGWGFRHVYVLNLHGDRIHRQTINEAITDAEKELGIDIFDAKTEGIPGPRPEIHGYRNPKPFMPDFHAGASETSMMLAYFPEEVNLDIAKTLKPEPTFHPLGYVGDPASYAEVDAHAYEAMMDYGAENIARWLKK